MKFISFHSFDLANTTKKIMTASHNRGYYTAATAADSLEEKIEFASQELPPSRSRTPSPFQESQSFSPILGEKGKEEEEQEVEALSLLRRRLMDKAEEENRRLRRKLKFQARAETKRAQLMPAPSSVPHLTTTTSGDSMSSDEKKDLRRNKVQKLTGINKKEMKEGPIGPILTKPPKDCSKYRKGVHAVCAGGNYSIIAEYTTMETKDKGTKFNTFIFKKSFNSGKSFPFFISV